ncbi:MAG: limA [Ilumatobacteraceae bacterium]|nr:limA [Ilumatobacteraceae bacterium]
MGHIQLVEEFVEAWHARDLARIVGFLAPDIEYHNIPLEPVFGIEATTAALAHLLGMITDLRWDVLNMAETADGTVLYEKIENYEINGSWVALRCMITLEFTADKISRWRAYFDLRSWLAEMRRVGEGAPA